MIKQSVVRWDRLLPFLFVLIVITLLSMFGLQLLGGAENIRAFVLGAGVWAPVVFILLKVLSNVLAPLSGAPLIISGSVLFGIWEGLAYILIGDLVGANLNFWIARLLGRPGIRRFIGASAIGRVDATVRYVGGWKALLVASLFFSVLYDFVSYAAGLSNLRYRHFFWITLVGCVPTALIYLLAGNAFVGGSLMIYALTVVAVIIGSVILVLRLPAIDRRTRQGR